MTTFPDLRPCWLCQSSEVSMRTGCAVAVELENESFVECTSCGMAGPRRPTPELAMEAWDKKAVGSTDLRESTAARSSHT